MFTQARNVPSDATTVSASTATLSLAQSLRHGGVVIHGPVFVIAVAISAGSQLLFLVPPRVSSELQQDFLRPSDVCKGRGRCGIACTCPGVNPLRKVVPVRTIAAKECDLPGSIGRSHVEAKVQECIGSLVTQWLQGVLREIGA